MTDKQHITIQIADAGPLNLNVKREEEEQVRKTVSYINNAWSQYRKQFKSMDSRDLLAMVAYQYARNYYSLVKKAKEQEEDLAEVENALDQILLDVK